MALDKETTLTFFSLSFISCHEDAYDTCQETGTVLATNQLPMNCWLPNTPAWLRLTQGQLVEKHLLCYEDNNRRNGYTSRFTSGAPEVWFPDPQNMLASPRIC